MLSQRPRFDSWVGKIPCRKDRLPTQVFLGFSCGSDPKESTCNEGDQSSWVGKIPWRRKWQYTPVFLPGESHGHWSLECYSPWGCQESDTTEQLTLSLSHFLLLASSGPWTSLSTFPNLGFLKVTVRIRTSSLQGFCKD